MVEPRTEAGRDTLADPYFAPPDTPFYEALRERILAIEREAAAASHVHHWGTDGKCMQPGCSYLAFDESADD